MLQKLQISDAENKKMRDSFAAYRAEKRQHTVQAKSDLELLKEVNKQLIQTTTDLQKQVTLLQQENFSEIQRMDMRITGLENATHTLATSTKTTSDTVNDIKTHLETQKRRIESSTKQAITESVNTALQSFMQKFSHPKRTRTELQPDHNCTSPDHKKPASTPLSLQSTRTLSQQTISFTPLSQEDHDMSQSINPPAPPDPHPGDPRL